MHDFLPSTGHFENTVSLSYTDIPNIAHFIIQYFKITLLSPPISPEKSLNIEKLPSSWFL